MGRGSPAVQEGTAGAAAARRDEVTAELMEAAVAWLGAGSCAHVTAKAVGGDHSILISWGRRWRGASSGVPAVVVGSGRGVSDEWEVGECPGGECVVIGVVGWCDRAWR